MLTSEMLFKILHQDWLVFIQLLGNRFPLPCNPKRPWRHENKDGNLCNEDIAKAICHLGIITH